MHELDPHINLSPLTVLQFKDFVPERKGHNIWTGRGKYEPLTYAMQAANTWITANPHIDLLNVETVVLPNIHSSQEEGSEDAELMISAGAGVTWHQFFRVWYIQRVIEE